MAMALLKLGAVRKKALLFVAAASYGVRLRLLLDAFGMRAAVLEGGQPLNSRRRVIQVLALLMASLNLGILAPLRVCMVRASPLRASYGNEVGVEVCMLRRAGPFAPAPSAAAAVVHQAVHLIA